MVAGERHNEKKKFASDVTNATTFVISAMTVNSKLKQVVPRSEILYAIKVVVLAIEHWSMHFGGGERQFAEKC